MSKLAPPQILHTSAQRVRQIPRGLSCPVALALLFLALTAVSSYASLALIRQGAEKYGSSATVVECETQIAASSISRRFRKKSLKKR